MTAKSKGSIDKTLPVFRINASTNVGKERDHNEDYHLFIHEIKKDSWKTFCEVAFNPDKNGTVLIVADGMGGANAGEIASEFACGAVKRYFHDHFDSQILNREDKIRDFLFSSVKTAQEYLLEKQETNHQLKGMGTTLIIAWIIKNRVYLVWIGDSRCYLFNPEKGLQIMSHDHSYVQSLVDNHLLTQEQAFFHPERNIITRSLGTTDHSLDLDKNCYTSFYFQPSDRLMLCSDGLNSMVKDNQIAGLLKNTQDTGQCVEALIQEANNEGGYDNITIILCDFLTSGKLKYKTDKNYLSIKKKRLIKLLILIIAFVLLTMLAFFIWKHFANTPIEKKATVPLKIDQQQKTNGAASTKKNTGRETVKTPSHSAPKGEKAQTKKPLKNQTKENGQNANGAQTVDPNTSNPPSQKELKKDNLLTPIILKKDSLHQNWDKKTMESK